MKREDNWLEPLWLVLRLVGFLASRLGLKSTTWQWWLRRKIFLRECIAIGSIDIQSEQQITFGRKDLVEALPQVV